MLIVFCRINRRFLLTSIVSLTLFFPLRAQQSYESGYLIERSGQRRDVSILNEDWRFNPEEILIRERPEADPVAVRTESLQEFGIDGKAKYVNVRVAIEKSSTDLGNLSPTPPVAQIERVVLRVEIEGPASLYSYLAPRITKFFLSEDGRPPRQLIFTRTRLNDGTVSESRTYIQQLNAHLNCPATEPADERLQYSLRALRRVVDAYNTCTGGGNTTIFENAVPDKKSFYVSLLAGMHLGDLKYSSVRRGTEYADFDNHPSPRIGIDLEFLPSFGGNKFAILFRPSYYRFVSSGLLLPGLQLWDRNETPLSVSYHALNLPFALRYYSFLNEKVTLFGTGSLGMTIPFGEVSYPNRTSNIDPLLGIGVELGLRYRDHWNLSVGYERYSYPAQNREAKLRATGLRVMAGYTL